MKFQFNRKNCARYSDVLKYRTSLFQKNVVQILWNQLYELTPIDTGAARSSWNISKNKPNYSFSPSKTSNTFIMPKLKLGDTVNIASGCPYMIRLNHGWSKQAPSYFIQQALRMAINSAEKIAQRVKNKDR